MSEISRILDQLHRSYHGNAWHGPAQFLQHSHREAAANLFPKEEISCR